MSDDLEHLPIPNWGLTCPECEYPLRGLPEHRCPECGLSLDVPSLIRPWTRLRDPRFTGNESPLPNFGLLCGSCRAPLAGATSSVCTACKTPFDPHDWLPAKKWFLVDHELCGVLPVPGVQAMLGHEGVPHFAVGERTFGEIWGGQSIMVARLRVPREFFFEVLWLLRDAHARMEAAREQRDGNAWNCARCGEENPANFDVCWNCQEGR